MVSTNRNETTQLPSLHPPLSSCGYHSELSQALSFILSCCTERDTPLVTLCILRSELSTTSQTNFHALHPLGDFTFLFQAIHKRLIPTLVAVISVPINIETTVLVLGGRRVDSTGYTHHQHTGRIPSLPTIGVMSVLY